MLPQPGAPAIVRNPKFDEFMDRKRNWIYDSPNNLDRDKALQEIFGVRKYEFNGFQKENKSAVDRYFDSTKNKKGPNGTDTKDPWAQNGRSTKNELDPAGRLSAKEDSPAAESSGIIPELNPAPLFNWDNGPDAISRAGNGLSRSSILPRGLGEPGFGQKNLIQPAAQTAPAPREFERTWDVRKSPLMGSRFADPINDQQDATRVLMNPTSVKKASVPPPESSQGRLGEPSAFGSSFPASTRPDFLGPGRDKPLGAPGFGTPAAAPASTPMLQPKPVVLEIPRPHF